MNEALFSRRDYARRGGFTLIEVVIALAIFLFGALAIIRIFPPALGIIQNSGDRLTALNLNRTTLARYAKDSSALPDAVYNGTLSNPVAFGGSTVGSAIRNNALPRSTSQSIAGSSLDAFKIISGEKQRVRSITVVSGGTPTTVLYVLTSFPIAGLATGTPPKIPIASAYKEVSVTGVVAETRTIVGASQSGYLNFTNSSPTLASLNTTNNDIFYASYQFLDPDSGGNGVLNGTVDEAVRAKTSNLPNPDITIDNAQILQGRRYNPATPQSRVVDGPIKLRLRQQLFNPTTNPNVSTIEQVQDTRNNLGLLIVTGVAAGDQISIDYQTNGWNQLVSNSLPSVVPEATPTPGPTPAPSTPTPRSPREVVLPLRFLADGKDGSAAVTYSLLSYLNTSGALSLEANAMNSSDVLLSPPGQFTLWGVNRKAGRILFDINNHGMPAQDYTVIQSRVVYQTLDNWNQQLSVAPANYTPYYDANINNASGSVAANTTEPQPWRYYFWDNKSAQRGRIFFPPSEAGKTISVSYSYAGGRVDGAIVPISDRWIPASNAPPGAQNLAAADSNGTWLAYADPKLSVSGAAVDLTSIQSVKGVSVQARTAWLDGDKFNQVSTVGFRGDSN